MPNSITEVTRRKVMDLYLLLPLEWSGRLSEPDFLARLYPLRNLPSDDYRFDDAYGDIVQHRVNNPDDWPDEYIFTDPRFNLLWGTDENFLNFLEMTVHPVVLSSDDAAALVETYNTILDGDGYKFRQHGTVSGHPLYTVAPVTRHPVDITAEPHTLNTAEMINSAAKFQLSPGHGRGSISPAVSIVGGVPSTTPKLFRPRLQGLIATALGSSEAITQADLDIIWTSFRSDESVFGGNKVSKANEIVRSLAKRPDADELFLELLNDVYYFSGKGDRRRQDGAAFKPLLVALFEKGFTIDAEDGIQRPHTVTSFAPKTEQNFSFESSQIPVPPVTSAVRNSVKKVGDGRSIFIVHGRNMAARDELAKFLRHLDAKPISWTDAAGFTKKASPTTMDIINAGMANAQAIVVLFTPDDEAKLKSGFIHDHDGIHEKQVTGQARQNVILEAGMALGVAPERTILVRLGQTRSISDIEGINWIDLGDSWENRNRLRMALSNANVTIEPNVDLMSTAAGVFNGIALNNK